MSYWRSRVLCSLLAVGGFAFSSVSFGQAVAEKQDADASIQSKGTPPYKTSLQRVTYDIKYLASDELGGRQPGTPEMVLSEDHIIAAYRSSGLVDPTGNNYKQTFDVGQQKTLVAEKCALKLTGPDGESIDLKVSEGYSQLLNRSDFDIQGAELVFVGYGINAEKQLNFDEYADIDVEGKVVVLIRREPQQKVDTSVFNGAQLSRWSFIASKVAGARQAKAAAILMVNDSVTVEEEDGDSLVQSSRFGQDVGSVPYMQIKRKTLDKILAATPVVTPAGDKLESIAAIEDRMDVELEPLSQTLPGWKVDASADFRVGGIATSNIVGVIEGEGPHADQTIVIGAHYDHLGKGAYGSRAGAKQRGMIHNGADDNATGTAAVMELARRFAARDKKPARRLVFVCFTAEEMGLLGAYHYVRDPIYPLDKTVAMINFDMIGWLREDKVTLYGWNSSAQFDKMFESANTDMGLELLKPPSGFAGSDHLPFNERRIPNTFIHTGLTSTYHTPDDDFKTIDCAGAVRVIDFTEAFIDELVNAEKPPKYAVAGPFRLGVNIEEVEEGLLLSTISDDSVAQASGLLEGDVILKWGDEKLTNRRGLLRAIRRDKGKTVPLKVKRDGAEIDVQLRLVRPGEEDEA